MVTYTVQATASARRALSKLPTKVACAVFDFMAGPLADSPHRVGKPLHDELAGLHSARIGTYRVLYEINDTIRVVEVMRIGHRADVYR